MKHKTKAEEFFTREEHERIRNMTRDVESRTSGEIAVMLVDSSEQYAESEVIGGVLAGCLSALIITVLFFHASLWYYIPFNFLFFFPFRFIFKKMPALKIPFISSERINIAVKHRAVRAFHDKGLYKTKRHTGVLFFLSLLERKVWILADKGIHSKIKQETLNRFAKTVSHGIRAGRGCDALCGAIKEAGALLAEHFPKTADDTDELPDDIMTA